LIEGVQCLVAACSFRVALLVPFLDVVVGPPRSTAKDSHHDQSGEAILHRRDNSTPREGHGALDRSVEVVVLDAMAPVLHSGRTVEFTALGATAVMVIALRSGHPLWPK
jgi:hypothetical protein